MSRVAGEEPCVRLKEEGTEHKKLSAAPPQPNSGNNLFAMRCEDRSPHLT